MAAPDEKPVAYTRAGSTQAFATRSTTISSMKFRSSPGTAPGTDQAGTGPIACGVAVTHRPDSMPNAPNCV